MTTSPRTVNPWIVLVIVGLAQFMVILDATIVNVALPSIQRGLHFSTDSLQWVVNAYTLSFGGFLLLGGRAADLFGRKRLFMAGIVLFSAASLLNGLAGSAITLVAGRALQGLGGALVSPAALSVITTSFREGRERTQALGVWSAIAVGGGAVGLLLGGVLTDLFSWQWVFFVNVPVGIGALLLALRFVPESRAPGVHRGVDVIGAVAITAGLMVLVYALVNAQQAGWVSSQTLILGALAVALIGGFLWLETRLRHPLVRLDIFRLRSLTSANLVMLLVAAGMFAMFFFASIYVQEVLGYNPLRAGLAFLPITAGIVIAAGLSQQLIKRFGVVAVGVVGMAVAASGLLLLSRIPVAGSYAGDLLPGLMTMAFGIGLTFVPITLVATTNVAGEDAGLASGLLNTSQQIGGALGLAVLSTLAANATASALAGLHSAASAAQRVSALVTGFHTAFVVGAILMFAGSGLLAVLVRRADVARIDEAPQPEPEPEAVFAA
ncbi:MAG: MFS transporter [Candidatus Dormibacteraeota bacterium]|nr:MFS transporter [Candidatus Dormibacteraeota bacterium]